MKKFLSIITAAVIATSLAVSVSAKADISVSVNGRAVLFREEPKPVILNDRTYVPLRRVLEEMGATVTWNGEERTVTVDSYDNITKIIMAIDDPKIKVYTFTSVFHADEEIVTSDVAPIILNDRTMLPIRVIAEALGAKVTYDDEINRAEIVTKQAKRVAERQYGADIADENFSIIDTVSRNLPKFSLYSDAENIKEGDEVFVYLKINDLDKYDPEAGIGGVATTVFYDGESFEYGGFDCLSGDEMVKPSLSVDNATFYDTAVKIVYLFAPDVQEIAEDGTAVRFKFTALKDGGGTFSISAGVSEVGYDNELIIVKEKEAFDLSKYDELYIDTAEITVK